MDNIKPHRGREGSRPHQRPIRGSSSSSASGSTKSSSSSHRKQRHSGQRYWLVRSIGKVAAKGKQTLWAKYKQTEFAKWPKRALWRRAYALSMVILFVVSTVGTFIQPFLDDRTYYISPQARTLLPKSNPQFGQLLQPNHKSEEYIYNGDFSGVSSADQAQGSNTPRFSASFSMDASKGIKISDKVSEVDMSLTPKFKLDKAQKEDNYLFYRLGEHDGVLAYTSRTASVKEDIILESYDKDTVSFEFELGLQEGLEARVEKDGSLGVYGSDLPINSNITTGSDADADLLQKVRQNAQKTKLLFQVPAPVVLESSKKPSKAKSRFELDGKTLRVVTDNLKQANYPLSIDPTVYIETAAKLMRGNNETNVDFDVENELIQKSQTTGARIDTWSSTTNLSSGVWGQGTAVAGGYIYSVGGAGGANTTTVEYRAAGASTFSVPAGVTSITVKTWGGGGGGGAGNSTNSNTGGNGGGAGYAKAVINTTPGETLDILVGAAGAKGGANLRGGDGGGYSSVQRSGTDLLVAGGGGGGGGRRGSVAGGAGGPGGSTTTNGSNGSGTSPAGGGGRGVTSGNGGSGGAGGTAGGSGGVAGAAGIAAAGGNGGGSGASCTTAVTGQTGGAGTAGGAGKGGNAGGNCAGGGGGGGGRYGGGGGGSNASSSNTRAAGGGGGGSSYINASGLVGGTDVLTAASGMNSGNNGDADNQGAGRGGTGGRNDAATTAGSDGAIVITYTVVGAAATNLVSWAQFNSTSKAIVSPNPGTGACAGWCNDAAYNLPTALKDLSLVAYNGFLYAIGGSNVSGTPQTSVYVAKLGANGEPQLWHPTDTNRNNWVYWYSNGSMNLPSARSKFGAVAYNNRLYILGGLTTSNTLLSSNTVQSANINPNGMLTSWSATGMSGLSTSRYGLSAQVYNNTLYVIGGSNTFTGAPVTTVQYARLNSDGTMNSWKDTNGLTSGRLTMGGNFSTIFAGYIYVAGGCATVNASGYCTSIRNDVQLASINSDGSLALWNTSQGLDGTRIGHTLTAWQGGLYRLGGCRSQNASNGLCEDTAIDVDYGVINATGEASTVETSVASGTGPCSGGDPYSCNLPGTSNIGNMLTGTAIINGYLYIIGGCTNNGCTSAIGNVAYQAIGSDGKLTRPASCPNGSFVNSYCVDTVNTLANSRVAASVAVFNGTIYVVGGNNGGSETNTILRNSVNTDGSLAGAWTSQSMTGVGATSVSFSYAYARANPAQVTTIPGNLFIFGGCTGTGPGCTGYVQAVYKCNIAPAGAISNCSTDGQLPIGTIPGGTGTGLAAHAGTVYANYIYLIGGIGNGIVDLKTVRYARFDNNNNVVTVGSGWVESSVQMNTGRRRGAGFGYNGHVYVVGGFEATTGVLADIEYAKIDVSDGSLIGHDGSNLFSVSSVTVNQRWGLSVAVSNSYAYVIGGCTVGDSPSGCTTRTDTIQTFQIYNNDSGTPVEYKPDDLFNTDRYGASSAIYNGYIYVAGGCTVADCSTTTNSVQYAPLDAYGDIGSWSAGGNLPAARAWGQLEAAGGSLYYMGGQNNAGTAQANVYYTTGISSGNPTWGTASNGLPAARTQHGGTVWNNRLYITGGNNTGGTAQTTVYVSPQLNSGGNITSAWTTSTGFSVARNGHTTIAYANNLYVLGGYTGSDYLSDTQFAKINEDGTVGSWTYSTTLPVGIRQGDGFAANGYIYLVGGRTSDMDCAPRTLVAPISANTTIATGNNPTGVGQWFETNVRYTGDRYGAAVSYNDGKIYVMGGACQMYPEVVGSVTTTLVSTNTNIHNVNLPTTSNGDLLIALFSNNGNTAVTTPSGWSLAAGAANGSNVRAGVYTRIANGTEGLTVDFNTPSTGETAAAHVYRIAAGTWEGSIANGFAVSTNVNATTTNPNPPALNPSTWDVEKTLWLAYAAGRTYTSVNSPPTGYTDAQHTNGGTGTTGASTGSARRFAAVASEDPLTFTMNGSNPSISYTLAVRPSVAQFTGANRVVQTAVYSQPQVAIYSRMIDTDTDVFPTGWLMNGIDNSIGARWQMSYRSMHDLDTLVNPNEDCGTSASMPAMTTWGQQTNFGNVTLGKVETYTPLNSSGGNINCARYFYFSISIDASQTFGYPEDVNRGPTINDISLFYRADASRRLRHGKSFNDGTKQPLDTPCRVSNNGSNPDYANCPLP